MCKAIDTAKIAVMIKHQAIASIDGSAMNMTLNTNPRGWLKDNRRGEKMSFTLHPTSMKSPAKTIVSGK